MWYCALAFTFFRHLSTCYLIILVDNNIIKARCQGCWDNLFISMQLHLFSYTYEYMIEDNMKRRSSCLIEKQIQMTTASHIQFSTYDEWRVWISKNSVSALSSMVRYMQTIEANKQQDHVLLCTWLELVALNCQSLWPAISISRTTPFKVTLLTDHSYDLSIHELIVCANFYYGECGR